MLQGCSPLALVNSWASSSTVHEQTGIRYGQDDRHQLDVYRPAKTSYVAAPVIVFFYGGNWNSGQRADYRFAGAALASKGYVAVLPDYRLYPQVRYPEFLADSAQAVRWVFDRIAEFGGDGRNVFLMGHSAGAYNASAGVAAVKRGLLFACVGPKVRAARLQCHASRSYTSIPKCNRR